MPAESLYSDAYVDVLEDHLILKDYYFLRFGRKRINFSDVVQFKEVRLTLFNGLARHESVWLKPRWPLDWNVKSRKEAFFIKPKGHWLGIGFSAERPREVALLIHQKLHTR
jgi:hypothetical protein